MLNGVSLATTFLSNTSLQATIPATSLTAIGEQYLTVVNPLPGGGVSPSVTVTPYQALVINPSALVSVPRNRIALRRHPRVRHNQPQYGDSHFIRTRAPLGLRFQSTITRSFWLDRPMARTCLQPYAADHRINLTTNVVERTFPYTPNIYCSGCTTLNATDLETVPGSPQEVLLAQGSILTLFNDTGPVNYVPGPACCYADPTFDSIALTGNPLTVYGLPFSFGGGYFQMASLTSLGLQYTRPTGGNGTINNSAGAQVISDGTLLYTNSGQVWNPATQTQVGTFPPQTVDQNNYPSGWNIALDTTLGEIYGVGSEVSGGYDYVVLSAFGLKSYALTGSLAFPQIYWPTEGHLVRWDTNGLAFIAPGVGLTDQEVYILRSSVVSPQSTNPTPTLASISPTSVFAGGPTFTLAVNGTGFLSSSVIEWNGTPLATAYVSAQQLTATVPSADIASASSAQVAVFNAPPGGGSSAAIVLSVVSPVATATLLSISPGNGTLTTGAAYTLTATVSAASGTGTPTGNVVFTIGSGWQTAVLNSSGVGTYTGTAPSTPGTLSISAAYQGATGFQASTSSILNETVAPPANPVPALSGLSPEVTSAGAVRFLTHDLRLRLYFFLDCLLGQHCPGHAVRQPNSTYGAGDGE